MLKDKILELLEQNQGKVLSGGELAKICSVSRTAVYKNIKSLIDEGYKVEIYKNCGYCLSGQNNMLSERLIKKNLTTELIGQKIEILKETDSTINYIKRQLPKFDEGDVVIADFQTGGKGRLGRTFVSKSGEGVYMSLLVKPKVKLSEIRFLTIITAVAVSDAIKKVSGIDVGLKWVNDIFYNGKKLCGILLEAEISLETQSVEGVVVGIGINTGYIDESIKEIATSLLEIAGDKVSRNELIAAVINEFEKTYFDFVYNGEKSGILKKYIKRQILLDKNVCVIGHGISYNAKAIGIDDDGALIVKLDNGEEKIISSGEVSLRLI